MRHKGVSIDPFSSMYWWYFFFLSNAMWLEICSNNVCIDLHMIMLKFWYYITWPSLQLEYEPAFPGRVATFVVWKTYATILKICLQTRSVCQDTSDLFSAFDSFIMGWEPETTGARNKWIWNVIQAIDWKESRWPKSALYKGRLLIHFWISGFR